MITRSECIGFWDFSLSNKSIRDLSGNNHDGVLSGNPQSVNGLSGDALSFKSYEDCVDFGAPIIPEEDFTISIWIKCDDVEKQFFLGQYIYKHPQRLDLAIREGRVRIQLGEMMINSPSVIEKNIWYHLAYTRERNALKIYVNSELRETGSLEGKVLQTESLKVGKILVQNPNRDSFRFTGAVDELRIYDTALPVEEIVKLTSRKCSLQG